MKKGVDKQHLFLYYMSSSAAVHYRKQNNDAWLSLVERCVRDAEVAGSNPVAPILKTPQIVSDLWGFVCLCKNFRLLFQ